MKQKIFILLVLFSGVAHSDDGFLGIDKPNARQMYVSCLLLQRGMETIDEKSVYSPFRCALSILSMIKHGAGKSNKNSLEGDYNLNFCLPDTTDPQALMIDAYVMGYEKLLRANAGFDPANVSGGSAFTGILSARFPCD